MKTTAIWFDLGQYLKAQRESKNLTQADLAKSIKLKSPQYISNWERGLISPSKRVMGVLMAELDLDVEIVTDFLLQKARNKIIREIQVAKDSSLRRRKKVEMSKRKQLPVGRTSPSRGF